MAAGDFALSAGKNPQVVGAEYSLTGTIQVDNTYRGFAILANTSYITSFVAVDSTGVGILEVDLNVNSAGTATLGSIGVAGNHATTETYNFRLTFANM